VQLLTDQGHDVTATGQRASSDLPSDFPDTAYHRLDLSAPVEPLIDLASSADRIILAAGAGFYRAMEREEQTALARTMAIDFSAVVQADARSLSCACA